jgi:hypothetical protein
VRDFFQTACAKLATAATHNIITSEVGSEMEVLAATEQPLADSSNICPPDIIDLLRPNRTDTSVFVSSTPLRVMFAERPCKNGEAARYGYARYE